MFLKGVWFLIAGVLLLGHPPALAETYLRVCKKGVIYYYFSSQGPPPTEQQGLNPSRPPVDILQPLIQEPSPPHHLLLASVKAPIPGKSQAQLAAASTPDAPDLLKVVNPGDAQDNFWAAIRYPIRMLTKLGCYYPRAQTAAADSPQRLDQKVSSLQRPQAADPDGLGLLAGTREERAAWSPGPQIPGFWAGSPTLRYCFPVASHFSFRNSWGDPRPGGRLHRAVDIFAREGTGVYAVTAGVIKTLTTFRGAGITLMMLGLDGKGYAYMHLRGFAPGIVEGKLVRAGELIGYVGHTGVRQGTPHLHFQVYADHRLGRDELLNPYFFLVQLCHGIGVEDLHHQRLARLENQEMGTNRIRVYRRTAVTALKRRGSQSRTRNSSVLVIKNF